MRSKPVAKIHSKLTYASQNAQTGLITSSDLSLLIGVEAAQLNTYAKKGWLGFYGEYHGKRLFKFDEIINTLTNDPDRNEAQGVIMSRIESTIKKAKCPYSLISTTDAAGNPVVRLQWKEAA